MPSGTLKEDKFGAACASDGSNSNSQTRHMLNTTTNSWSECLSMTGKGGGMNDGRWQNGIRRRKLKLEHISIVTTTKLRTTAVRPPSSTNITTWGKLKASSVRHPTHTQYNVRSGSIWILWSSFLSFLFSGSQLHRLCSSQSLITRTNCLRRPKNFRLATTTVHAEGMPEKTQEAF